jgi:hypothetical protein
MEDRLIALTPWVLALFFEAFAVVIMTLAVLHFDLYSVLAIAAGVRILIRTLPMIIRRISEAWRGPFGAAA